MINFSEIQPGDLLKVLVNIDDVDDETQRNQLALVANYHLITVPGFVQHLSVNSYSIAGNGSPHILQSPNM